MNLANWQRRLAMKMLVAMILCEILVKNIAGLHAVRKTARTFKLAGMEMAACFKGLVSNSELRVVV